MNRETGELLAAIRELMDLRTELPMVLTYEMAARELSVSLSTIKTMVATGDLVRCHRGPGGWGISRDEILRYVSTRDEEAPQKRRRSLVVAKSRGFDVKAELAALDAVSVRRKRR